MMMLNLRFEKYGKNYHYNHLNIASFEKGDIYPLHNSKPFKICELPLRGGCNTHNLANEKKEACIRRGFFQCFVSQFCLNESDR